MNGLIITQNQAAFTTTADVIVVGLGVAGASAAIGAAEANADVLVIERTSGGGGTSAAAAGYLYLGGGTHSQRANGYADTPENMLAFLKALNPTAPMDKLRIYSEQSVAHLAWLEALGVPFNDRFYPHKHIMHTSDETLAWTGSEDAWPYLKMAEPIPRGHKIESRDAGGHLLVSCLIRRCRDLGIAFRFDSRVTSLFTDATGAVVGVRCREAGRDYDLRARRGVVLATGGYEWNRQMVETHTPVLTLPGITPLGAPTADGSGILLGIAAGARLVNMAGYDIASPWYPPEGLIRGILVNRHGKRFINEDVYHGRSTDFVLKQPDQRAFLICDNKIFERPATGAGHQLIDAWETPAEMAEALGMPPRGLQETLADYNHFAAMGQDPEHHKQARWLTPLDEAPYAALDCSLGAAHFLALSMGGLDATIDGEVISVKGAPVSALFAAGVMAPSIAYNASDYASGMLLGSGSLFGRRAGKAAAAQRPR